jgi:hypothetical protein
VSCNYSKINPSFKEEFIDQSINLKVKVVSVFKIEALYQKGYCKYYQIRHVPLPR